MALTINADVAKAASNSYTPSASRLTKDEALTVCSNRIAEASNVGRDHTTRFSLNVTNSVWGEVLAELQANGFSVQAGYYGANPPERHWSKAIVDKISWPIV